MVCCLFPFHLCKCMLKMFIWNVFFWHEWKHVFIKIQIKTKKKFEPLRFRIIVQYLWIYKKKRWLKFSIRLWSMVFIDFNSNCNNQQCNFATFWHSVNILHPLNAVYLWVSVALFDYILLVQYVRLLGSLVKMIWRPFCVPSLRIIDLINILCAIPPLLILPVQECTMTTHKPKS